MISTPYRQTAVALINEAITAGARRALACAALEISDRTLRRWTRDGQVHADQRPLVPHPEPANKLSAAPLCQGSCPLLYFYSISQVGGIGR